MPEVLSGDVSRAGVRRPWGFVSTPLAFFDELFCKLSIPIGEVFLAMEKSLKEFKQGETGVVARVNADGPIKRRLFDMGITPGTTIEMRKTAPLGDPIEICIRGYELSVRKNEAEAVLMNTNGDVSQ